MQIVDTIVADSAYEWLTIGCFQNDANMSWKDVGGTPIFVIGYYFLDDVSVTPLDTIPYTAPHDTTICNGNDVLMQASGGSSYIWTVSGQPNDTLSTNSFVVLSPTTSTNYDVTIFTTNCGSVTHTFKVTVVPFVTIPGDSTICPGDSVFYNFANNYSATWSHGPTGATYLSNAGTYIVTYSNMACSATDTIIISHHPRIDAFMADDATACPETPYTLSALYNPLFSYAWSTGHTTASIQVDTPGIITVSLTDSFLCIWMDTFSIAFYNYPALVGPPDSTLCKNSFYPLIASGADNIQWYLLPSGELLTILPEQIAAQTRFLVTGSNGCPTTDTDTVVVSPMSCENPFIPNAFTPNFDGANDEFFARGIEAPMSYELIIYDRFGHMIFSTTDPDVHWSGIQNGEPMNEGVYVYHLKAEMYDGEQLDWVGNVQLIH